jgi:hypothetical protein
MTKEVYCVIKEEARSCCCPVGEDRRKRGEGLPFID